MHPQRRAFGGGIASTEAYRQKLAWCLWKCMEVHMFDVQCAALGERERQGQ